MSMTIDYMAAAPEVVRPLYDASKLLAQSGLDQKLLVLVQVRVSQINGCAFCLALHRREGEALGDSADRLFGVAAWREATWYSTRERAALEWAEALTLVAREHPHDDLLARMKEHFSDKELAFLTLAVNAINAWNRLNVAFGTPPDRAEEVFKQLQRATAGHV